MGHGDTPLQHSNWASPHRCSTASWNVWTSSLLKSVISVWNRFPRPEQPCVCVTSLPRGGWPGPCSGRQWFPPAPRQCQECCSHLPSFLAHLGRSGMAGGFGLVELAGSAENRTQICCLSLSGSICYCSAPALFIFIPPHAWLEAQVDEFSIQVVNMLQPPHVSSCCFRHIYKLVLNI